MGQARIDAERETVRWSVPLLELLIQQATLVSLAVPRRPFASLGVPSRPLASLTPLRRNVSLREFIPVSPYAAAARRPSWIARPWNSKFAFHNLEYPIHFSSYLPCFSVRSGLDLRLAPKTSHFRCACNFLPNPSSWQ